MIDFIRGGTWMTGQNRFTVRQAASELQRHPNTIYRWIDEGFIRCVRIRRGYFIPLSEIRRVQVDINYETAPTIKK